MKLTAGTFIKSTSLLSNDAHFFDSIIYLTECNEKGAMGFIVNKKFNRNFNELVEFNNSPEMPLWLGGPVAGDKLFFIHQRPDLISGTTLIANGIYYGGNFEDALKLINRLVLTTHDIKLFIGYCGWDAGELEAEMEEGSWEMILPQKFF